MQTHVLSQQRQCCSRRLPGQQSCSNSSSSSSAGSRAPLRLCRSSSSIKALKEELVYQTQRIPLPPQQRPLDLLLQQDPQAPAGSSSRRQLLGRMLAVGSAVLLLPAVGAPSPAAAAAPAAAPVSSSAALEEYMKLEDANKLRDQRSLDNIRSKYGIRRALDGRVQLRRRDGTWMSVRLDMEVPGAILLRDTKSGAVYALETDSLPQVDLSDDYVLFMMFADGQWEADMTAIEFEEEGGKATSQLSMSEKEFHEFVGLLKEPDVPEPAGKGGKKK